MSASLGLNPTDEKQVELQLERRRLILAVTEAGSALADLGTVIIQGPRETNQMARGAVALGFERAARLVRNKSMRIEDEELIPPRKAAFLTEGPAPEVKVETNSSNKPQVMDEREDLNYDEVDGNTVVLGKQVKQPQSPTEARLLTVPYNKLRPNVCARFTCPEFTSLCPVTGQPDFATIVIDYMPNLTLVESKSLKLYLASYRNHGDYHEACTSQIAQDFQRACNPIWMRIAAYWYPRGGIPIDVFWQSGKQPEYAYIPALEVPQYRGR